MTACLAMDRAGGATAPRRAGALQALAAAGAFVLAQAAAFARAKPDAGLKGTERERFRLMVLPHLDAAYTLARYLSRDADAAQDITQEAFLRALRGFAGFRGEAARPWLFAIVRNCCHDWRARRGAAAQAENDGVEAVADEADDPEESLLRAGVSDGVRRTLSRLPEAFREVLVLREIEDLSYREIAEVVGAPIGTVMSRLSRARQLFGEFWRGEGADAGDAS